MCGHGKTEREREGYVEEHRPERTRGEHAVEEVMDRRISKIQKGKVMGTCVTTGVTVRNGNLGNGRTTTTKAASVRKQLGTKNSKSDEGRQEKNGGVKGRDGSAEELDTTERMSDDKLLKRATTDKVVKKVAGSTLPLTKGKRGRERYLVIGTVSNQYSIIG